MTKQEIEICKRIKLFRTEIGMTQTDFGEKIEVAQGYLTNIETAKRPATEKIIKLILLQSWNGKKVDEDWLRHGKGEMFEKLTDKEKLMKATALLLKDSDSAVVAAIQALIITYEQLDDVSKAVLEKIALQYIDNLKKSQ